jgi:hypothetical protein
MACQGNICLNCAAGGDTAGKVASTLSGIDTLLTVDPVSNQWGRPNPTQVANRVRRWINVQAKPTSPLSPGDHVALAGGKWNETPRGHATQFFSVDGHHEEFQRLMETEGPDGRSPLDLRLEK